MKENITVDRSEIEHFSRMAGEWWDPAGKFRPLHEINPVRLAFIRDHIAARFARDTKQSEPFKALSMVDIGCGGGLICEPLSRLGGNVTGIDAASRNIEIATLHAQQMELSIDYRAITAEALGASGQQYDVVLALEIVEHVAHVPAFLKAVSALVKPGGLLFMSTLNRTFKAHALAIVGAEYILRWLPRGTHTWKKFLKPSELVIPLEREGIATQELMGLVFDLPNRSWKLSPKDLDVNYLLVGRKSLT